MSSNQTDDTTPWYDKTVSIFSHEITYKTILIVVVVLLLVVGFLYYKRNSLFAPSGLLNQSSLGSTPEEIKKIFASLSN